MLELPAWVVLNLFTIFLLVLLLVFQKNTSRLQRGKRYSAILVCTLVLIIAESIGRIGETYPDKYIVLAHIGYYLIFLLDPLDVLYALNYIDCWMDNENQKRRNIFRAAFLIFAVFNIATVTLSELLGLKWFFYFSDGVYYRGEYFVYRAIFVLIFISLLFVYAFMFKKDIMSEYKNAILFLPLLSLLGAILQIFVANLNTTYAGISWGCMILFFFFQSKDVNMDYLTGVLNRRGLDMKMQEMVKNSISTGKNFTAIMMDVDNFKDINDHYGHETGDRAIKAIADIIVNVFGDNTSIGRFGGDEFCVITSCTSVRENKAKILEIRTAIYRLCKKNGWSENLDISCGMEIYDKDSDISAEQFQEIIDTLMYENKMKHHGM
ncbi:MAG: GGDEF domain-containing protein [Pseudobutyrivibrio sp.]|nr:GGDEF domain-containing protein [Pseudobutyrivibrio sp.]